MEGIYIKGQSGNLANLQWITRLYITKNIPNSKFQLVVETINKTEEVLFEGSRDSCFAALKTIYAKLAGRIEVDLTKIEDGLNAKEQSASSSH